MTPSRPFPWSLLPQAERLAPDADLGLLLRRALQGSQPQVQALLTTTLALGEVQVTSPGEPGERHTPGNLELLFLLREPGGAMAELCVGPPLTGHLLARLGAPEHAANPRAPIPPGAAEAGLMAGLLDAALQDLNADFMVVDVSVPRGSSALPQTPTIAPSLQIKAQLVVGEHAGWVHGALDRSAARQLRDAALRQPFDEAHGARVPVVGTFVAANARVTASRIADLELGDVIAFPACPHRVGEPLAGRLRFGRGAFGATLRPDHTLAIQGAFTAMDPGNGPHETRPAPDLPDRQHVTLSLEVGQLELFAAEVAHLTPGAVIALDRPLGDPVTLKAGSRQIARGELIEVEGSVGIRLTELLS